MVTLNAMLRVPFYREFLMAHGFVASDRAVLMPASPTASPLRGHGRAGAQNDRLGESFPTVRSTCPPHVCTHVGTHVCAHVYAHVASRAAPP